VRRKPVCTCAAEGSTASRATIYAVTANCDEHGVVAVKSGKRAGAVCTCFTSASAAGGGGGQRASVTQSMISKASCSKHGNEVARANPDS